MSISSDEQQARFPLAKYQGRSFNDAWYFLLNDLLVRGIEASPRGMPTRELLGVQLHVEDMLENIVDSERNLNHKFMVAEWLWIMNGFNDVATIAQYNSKMKEFSDDGVYLAGAYGPRIKMQLSLAVDKLIQDRDTRQAVIAIWTPNPPNSRDIPCTLTMQFLVRGEKLHALVNMRSSDIWLGLPYDFFTFSMIANYVAGYLEVPPGSLTFTLGSSHLYESNVEAAKLVKLGQSVRSPQLTTGMPTLMAEILQEPSGKWFTAELHQPWLTYADVLQDPRKMALPNLKGLTSWHAKTSTPTT